MIVAAAGAARTAGKPVVLLTVGRTTAGKRAALSHTGALTSDRDAVDAACRAGGIHLVNTPRALVDTAQALLKDAIHPNLVQTLEGTPWTIAMLRPMAVSSNRRRFTPACKILMVRWFGDPLPAGASSRQSAVKSPAGSVFLATMKAGESLIRETGSKSFKTSYGSLR